MKRVTPVKVRMEYPPVGEKNPPSKFIRLEPVLAILRAAIWTGRLADEDPVSVMLIAKQESMKSECLKYFRGTPTLAYVSDLTSKGLIPFKGEIEKVKLRHLVLMDFIRIVAHKPSVSERTVQSLASMIAEGEGETSDAGGRTTWNEFPRIGLLTSLTPEFFRKRKGKWRDTGFLSRFVPVSFSYTNSTAHDIHLAIAYGHRIPPAQPENVPPVHFQISLEPKDALTLSQKAEELGHAMETYGFRYQRVLRALAKAQARIEGRGKVEEADIASVLHWSEFFTFREVIL